MWNFFIPAILCSIYQWSEVLIQNLLLIEVIRLNITSVTTSNIAISSAVTPVNFFHIIKYNLYRLVFSAYGDIRFLSETAEGLIKECAWHLKGWSILSNKVERGIKYIMLDHAYILYHMIYIAWGYILTLSPLFWPVTHSTDNPYISWPKSDQASFRLKLSKYERIYRIWLELSSVLVKCFSNFKRMINFHSFR